MIYLLPIIYLLFIYQKIHRISESTADDSTPARPNFPAFASPLLGQGGAELLLKVIQLLLTTFSRFNWRTPGEV